MGVHITCNLGVSIMNMYVAYKLPIGTYIYVNNFAIHYEQYFVFTL